MTCYKNPIFPSHDVAMNILTRIAESPASCEKFIPDIALDSINHYLSNYQLWLAKQLPQTYDDMLCSFGEVRKIKQTCDKKFARLPKALQQEVFQKYLKIAHLSMVCHSTTASVSFADELNKQSWNLSEQLHKHLYAH